MIQIIIDLHPFGDETKAQRLGAIIIANDNSGTDKIGNYEYGIARKGKKPKAGKIKGFPRQKKDVIDLLKLVLDDYYKNL